MMMAERKWQTKCQYTDNDSKGSTVELLYNGHPWDWAKVTLIAG